MNCQKIKLAVVGDSGIGKSCILSQYTENVYCDGTRATVGIDFKIKTVEINNRKYKLQIWDTAGQERYRSITFSYYKGVNGFIVVFDVTDQTSFKNVEDVWIKNIKRHGIEDAEIILIGNKCDETQHIDVNEIRKLVEEYNITYFETSAKKNTGIREAFDHIARRIILKTLREEISPIVLHQNTAKCC